MLYQIVFIVSSLSHLKRFYFFNASDIIVVAGSNCNNNVKLEQAPWSDLFLPRDNRIIIPSADLHTINWHNINRVMTNPCLGWGLVDYVTKLIFVKTRTRVGRCVRYVAQQGKRCRNTPWRWLQYRPIFILYTIRLIISPQKLSLRLLPIII